MNPKSGVEYLESGMSYQQIMRRLVTDIMFTGITTESMYMITEKVHLTGKGDRSVLLGRLLRYHRDILLAKMN